jgi:ribonuclease P protein component
LVLNQTFSRSNRLIKPSEFKEVFSNAKYLNGKFWKIVISRDLNHIAKLGLAISKKNNPRAVDRNRIKRIARENFRQAQHLIAKKNLVVMANKVHRNVTSKTLSEEFCEMLNKIK